MEIAPPMSTSLFGRGCAQAGPAPAPSTRSVTRAQGTIRIAVIVICGLPSFGLSFGRGVEPKPLESSIERMAEAVTEEVEAEHGNEDGEPGKERQPGVVLDEGHVGLEVPAPARRRRRGREAVAR